MLLLVETLAHVAPISLVSYCWMTSSISLSTSSINGANAVYFWSYNVGVPGSVRVLQRFGYKIERKTHFYPNTHTLNARQWLICIQRPFSIRFETETHQNRSFYDVASASPSTSVHCFSGNCNKWRCNSAPCRNTVVFSTVFLDDSLFKALPSQMRPFS